MIRASLQIALAFLCLVGAGAAHCGQEGLPALSAAAPEVLRDDELSEQRGGFNWLGLDIRFGAEIRSYIGDELVMLTNVNWTGATNEVHRIVSDALTLADSQQLDALHANGVAIKPGDMTVFVANQGQTAFIQRTDGVIQNIIANVASGVDLRQQVDVKLDVANYGTFQDSILAARIGAALTAMNSLVLARASPD